MAVRIEAELNANTKQAQREVEKLNDRIVKVSKNAKKAGQDISLNLRAINPVIRELDRFTGGLATKFVEVGKAARLSGKAMKTALISTGIGLIVVALALVVEYWDDISKLIDGVSSEQEKLLKNTQETLAIQQDQLSATNAMESTLKLQGKSEKEIRDIKRQQTNEIIASTELLLEQQKQTKKSQVEAAERNKKIATGILAFLSMPITILLGAVDALTAGLAKVGVLAEGTKLAEEYLDFTTSLIFDPEQVAKDGDEEIKETEKQLRKLKNTRDSFLLQDKQDEKKNKETTKPDKLEVDPAVAAKAKAIEEITKLEDEYFQKQLDDRTREENLVSDKYFNLLEQAKLFGLDTTDLEEARLSELNAIKIKYDDIDKKNKDAETDAAIKLSNSEKDAKLSNLEAVSGALNGLSALAGENAQAQKVIGIAQATIDTFVGANKAIGQGGIAGIAAAVGIIAAGLANVRTIMTTKIPNQTGGDTGSSAPQRPSFNIVGQSPTNQLAGAIGMQEQQPIQTFVVSSDVTTSQELERNIIDGASIG